MKTKPNEFDYFQFLNLNIYIPDKERINLITDIVFDELNLPNTNPRIAKEYLKVLILNLAQNHHINKKLFTAVRMTVSEYKPNSRYNKNGVARKVTEIVHALDRAGMIEFHKGYNDKKNPANSYVSKMKATQRLISLTNKSNYKLEVEAIGYRPDTEPIIVREKIGKKNKDIEYKDNKNTNNFRKLMQDYNNLIHATNIDVYGRKKNAGILFGKQKQPIIISQKNKFVRRIFNSKDLKEGGRLYGGWWQSLNSEWRSRITFDNKPTAEVDYSGMGVRLLYDKFNIPMYKGDAYDLSPVGYTHSKYDIEDLRPLLKQSLIIMINSKSYKECLSAIRKAITDDTENKFPSDVSIEPLIQAFTKRHEPISKYFYSSMGNIQYRLDSDIATYIISHFLYGYSRTRRSDEDDYMKLPFIERKKYLKRVKAPSYTKEPMPLLVLCIHDSFIIQAERKRDLEKVMQQAYISYMDIDTSAKISTKSEKEEFILEEQKLMKPRVNITGKLQNTFIFKKNVTLIEKRRAVRKDKELLERKKKFNKLKVPKDYYSNEEPDNYIYKNIPSEIREVRIKRNEEVSFLDRKELRAEANKLATKFIKEQKKKGKNIYKQKATIISEIYRELKYEKTKEEMLSLRKEHKSKNKKDKE